MASGVGNEYLPFKPTKNQSFRLYFSRVNNDGNFGVSGITAYISKDGGARSATSNTIQTAATGAYYIDLTADEMNADVVQFIMDGDTFNRDATISIFTSGYTTWTDSSGGGGLAQTDAVSGEEYLPTSNPTVGDLLQALYWYLRKYKNRRGK